jgi:iron-sulfur cluster assembly accessory protein
MVSVSVVAAEKLRGILEQEGQSGKALRVRVVPGGCSGYSYDMIFDDPQASDRTFESNGLRVVVDQESLGLLDGAEIDFKESFGSSGFSITNPNAVSGCGCGKSFQT